jgi:Phytochelatin synthase
MTRALKLFAMFVGVLFTLLGLVLAYFLIPRDDPQVLPNGLISLHAPAGRELLTQADALADYSSLSRSYETQSLTSFCGVASSVAVLNALGHHVTQTSLFNDEASKVSPIWRVALGGMTLDTLERLLKANGAETSLYRADASSVTEFRSAIKRNLMTDRDYLVVNYQREKLGQGAVGHISPISAYDEESDKVLVMDTAAYKYPPTWVPVEALYKAMFTVDPENGLSRGWLEVSETPRRL